MATAFAQQPSGKPQESADTAELSRLERIWNEAHMRNDADALDRLFSDDVVVTVPNMRLFNKSDATGILRSGHMKFQRYETSDLRIRVLRGRCSRDGPAGKGT